MSTAERPKNPGGRTNAVDERRAEFARYKEDVKKRGKPFHPYAMLHDTIMSLVVVAVIIALACIWYFTSGEEPGDSGILGPRYTEKAEPETIAFVPRPDWYFYFLFYLLRIFKWPESVILGTIGIPTIAIILLLAVPFIDKRRERRLSRRPIAVISAILVIASMAVLTWKGATVREFLAGDSEALVEEWIASGNIPERGWPRRAPLRGLGLPELPHLPRRRVTEPGRARAHERGPARPRRRVPDPAPDEPAVDDARLPDASVPELHRPGVPGPGGLPRGVRGRRLARTASLRAAVRVFLGITGASGAPYAARLLRALSEAGCEVGVCISDAGHEVLATELYGDPSLPPDEVVARLTAGLAGVVVYGKDDYSSPYASGSARSTPTSICPCSMATAASIAAGAMANLVHRAASVALKEGRRLVLVPRETPLSSIHLENLLRLAQRGRRRSSSPRRASTTAPQTIDDLVDFVVARCLDQLGIENALMTPVGPMTPLTDEHRRRASRSRRRAADVRPHHPGLRPDEPRHDGRARPALAAAGGRGGRPSRRSRPRRLLRHGRSRSRLRSRPAVG